jgi:hypothetical protein
LGPGDEKEGQDRHGGPAGEGCLLTRWRSSPVVAGWSSRRLPGRPRVPRPGRGRHRGAATRLAGGQGDCRPRRRHRRAPPLPNLPSRGRPGGSSLEGPTARQDPGPMAPGQGRLGWDAHGLGQPIPGTPGQLADRPGSWPGSVGSSGTEAMRSTCHPSYLWAPLTGCARRCPASSADHLSRDGTAPGGGDSLADPSMAAQPSADRARFLDRVQLSGTCGVVGLAWWVSLVGELVLRSTLDHGCSAGCSAAYQVG